MKHLVILLALLIALPTAQAGYCGVGDVRDSVEQSADGHDCCPGEAAEEPESGTSCGDGNHCSGCMIAMSAVPVAFLQIAHARPGVFFDLPLPQTAPSHALPPYRPPIS